ncbi:MAG: twin-arginine translocase TatA/TatE family subunit [Actinomycetota bacterium]|nr:twin-arginine translocase TatA/TatE family subunit [Actinomycetota bacterium]
MPGPLSIWEIFIILLVLLLVFGTKRLPEMGRSLGRGMREFKDAVSGNLDDEPETPDKAELAPPPPPETTSVTAQPESERVSP